ncbi:MAG TPA: hypothetical protein VKS81_00440 [Bacteroidota bacterium]|nr:hypothetical protein [Bacteroidota bacterium]
MIDPAKRKDPVRRGGPLETFRQKDGGQGGKDRSVLKWLIYGSWIMVAVATTMLSSCSPKSAQTAKPAISDTLVNFYADFLVFRYDTTNARLLPAEYEAKIDSLYRLHHLDSLKVTTGLRKMNSDPAVWEVFFGAVSERISSKKPKTGPR